MIPLCSLRRFVVGLRVVSSDASLTPGVEKPLHKDLNLPNRLQPSMSSYVPAEVVKHPQLTSANRTPEARYWRRFKSPTYIKEYAPIVHLHFAPSKPHRLAVTSSAEVKVYAPRTNKVVKNVSRFKETARSGEIRSDGNLLVAGDDSGLVQVSFPIFFNF